MGLNSYYYDGLQPKMYAGMIKLHEVSPLRGLVGFEKKKKSMAPLFTVFFVSNVCKIFLLFPVTKNLQ